VIEPLAEHYRVIAPDLPGHGQSSKPFINYRIQTFTDFLNQLYHALAVDQAVLIGHSASGAASAKLALDYPNKVRALVLVDAGYAYAIPDVSDSRQLGHNPGTLWVLSPATREQARQLFALGSVQQPSDKIVDDFFAQSLTSAYAMGKVVESFARREDVLDGVLGTLKQPTLIVWGREDKITPAALGERMAREIINSKFVVIDESGHSPNVEQSAYFNAAVLPFLESIYKAQ
jgi:pimeloyl-ACP methyl ester carboxylesterase